MKIVFEKPPNYDKIAKVFTITKGTIFAYGDTIYNPDMGPIDRPLMAHEEVHSRQQGDKVEGWWNRYLIDPDFRLAQEIEAYQVQYQVGKAIIKDRNKLARWLSILAKELSSPLYGQVIGFNDALQAIKRLERYHFDV